MSTIIDSLLNQLFNNLINNVNIEYVNLSYIQEEKNLSLKWHLIYFDLLNSTLGLCFPYLISQNDSFVRCIISTYNTLVYNIILCMFISLLP